MKRNHPVGYRKDNRARVLKGQCKASRGGIHSDPSFRFALPAAHRAAAPNLHRGGSSAGTKDLTDRTQVIGSVGTRMDGRAPGLRG